MITICRTQSSKKHWYGRKRRRRRRRWARAPVIHAASHVSHKKRVAWVSISMHTCGSVSIIMVLRRGSAKNYVHALV